MNKIQYSFILSRFLLQVIVFLNSIYTPNSPCLSSSLSDMQRPETSGHSLEISLVRSVGVSDVPSSVPGTTGEGSKNCFTNTSHGSPCFSACHSSLITVVPGFTHQLLHIFPASANTFLATIPVFANSLGPQLSQPPLAAAVTHFRYLLWQHPANRYQFLYRLIFAYNKPPYNIVL